MTLAGVAVGYFGTMIFKSIDSSRGSNRYMASIQIAKMGAVQNAQNFFEIRSKADVIAQNQNETSTIKVIITPYGDYNDSVNYSWEIPDDARVVSGNVNGIISKFEKNKPIELAIDVAGFSKEKRNYISFKIDGQINTLPVSQDILVSSRPEDSFEYLIQQNAVASDKKSKKLAGDKDSSRFNPKNIVH